MPGHRRHPGRHVRTPYVAVTRWQPSPPPDSLPAAGASGRGAQPSQQHARRSPAGTSGGHGCSRSGTPPRRQQRLPSSRRSRLRPPLADDRVSQRKRTPRALQVPRVLPARRVSWGQTRGRKRVLDAASRHRGQPVRHRDNRGPHVHPRDALVQDWAPLPCWLATRDRRQTHCNHQWPHVRSYEPAQPQDPIHGP